MTPLGIQPENDRGGSQAAPVPPIPMAGAPVQPALCPRCGSPLSGEPACPRCGQPLAHPAGPSTRRVRLQLPIGAGPSWTTRGLLAANLLVFIAMAAVGTITGQQPLSELLSSPAPDLLLRFGAKYGPAILEGEYWRFLTAIFLHNGLIHLGINSYALYIMGTETERFFGPARYLIIYLLAGIASVIASYLADGRLAVGASGAIFGLVGALAVFFLRNRHVFGAIGRRQLGNLVLVVVVNLVFGFSVSGIDNWAHMGGLAAGLLLAWVLTPHYEVVLLEPERSHEADPVIHGRVHDRNPLKRNRWVVPAALLFCSVLALVGNAREGNSAVGHQLRGEELLRSGDVNSAVDEFSAALALDDDLWAAYLYRGEAFLSAGNLAAALTDFEVVITSSAPVGHRAIAHTGRARVYFFRAAVGEALNELDQALSLAPAEPFAYYLRGVIYHEIGEFALSAADLQRALDLGLSDEQSVAVATDLLLSLEKAGAD